jgi:diguanylate cyclase
MHQSIINKTPKTSYSAAAANIARLAFPMMTQHHVEPTPHNYAVWYYYVVAENKDLVKEIDQIIEQGLTFSADTNQYLYNKHIASHTEQTRADAATSAAQHIMAQVLQIIAGFSGETSNYNQEIDEHVKKLSEVAPETSMREMVKEIISRVQSIRDTGSKMQEKLTESSKEIESLKKNLDQVSIEAKRDFLTGAANRKCFDAFLEEQVKLAKQNQTDLCLLMIDIDHFKQFNDKFGHMIGDEVLKTVAKSLVDTVRGKDLVARYGGEEFSVVLPTTPLQGGVIVAEALRKSIASSDLIRKDTGLTIGSITISIGVASFKRDMDSIATLIARADEALYASKKSGRNRVTSEHA